MKNNGMGFEMLLDYTNEVYKRIGKAIVNKRPTPVKIIKSDRYGRVTGHVEKKSTVDYDGIYQGRRLDFEAKSIEKLERFDLKRIESHQYEHLQRCHKHGSISFVLVEFRRQRKTYLLPFITLQSFMEAADRGGRKSMRIEDFDIHAYEVPVSGVPVDYLEIVKKIWFAETA